MLFLLQVYWCAVLWERSLNVDYYTVLMNLNVFYLSLSIDNNKTLNEHNINVLFILLLFLLITHNNWVRHDMRTTSRVMFVLVNVICFASSLMLRFAVRDYNLRKIQYIMYRHVVHTCVHRINNNNNNNNIFNWNMMYLNKTNKRWINKETKRSEKMNEKKTREKLLWDGEGQFISS